MLFTITANENLKKEIEKIQRDALGEPTNQKVWEQNRAFLLGDVNPYIQNKLKGIYVCPNNGFLDSLAYDIVEEAARIIKEREAEKEQRFKEYEACHVKHKELEEAQDWAGLKEFKEANQGKFDTEYHEVYEGVLIADDVPNYLTPYLMQYLRIEGIVIHWMWKRPIVETKGYAPDKENSAVMHPIEVIEKYDDPIIFGMFTPSL